MKITIWGARGSLPTPLTTPELREILHDVLERSRNVQLNDGGAIERFIERLPRHLNTIVSGNTTCVEVRAGESVFILDMGSGIRALGEKLMNEGFREGQGVAHIFISHTHFDHVEGFPFFVPAFIPGNELHFHTPYPDMEQRLRDLMRHPYFPVDLDYPQGKRFFHLLEPGQTYTIGGVEVDILPLDHPGGSFAYRLKHQGKIFVFATDGEYINMNQENTARYEDFYHNADALFFDAMYTYQDSIRDKVTWGHSSPSAGAELAWRAGVKRLILTHHDPKSTSQQLWASVDEADRLLRHRVVRLGDESATFVKVMLAYEGLTLEI